MANSYETFKEIRRNIATLHRAKASSAKLKKQFDRLKTLKNTLVKKKLKEQSKTDMLWEAIDHITEAQLYVGSGDFDIVRYFDADTTHLNPAEDLLETLFK